METWLSQHVVSIIIAIVAAVGAFFALKAVVEILKIKNKNTEKTVEMLKENFERHLIATVPHNGCQLHGATMLTLEKGLSLKVDDSVHEIKHETVLTSVQEIKDEIKLLKEELSPLTEIKGALDRIERKLNGKGI